MEWGSSLPVNEDTLVSLGILTTERIRKYPLRYANLQAVLKVYAIETHQPFRYYIYGHARENTCYYLTEYGLEWFYAFFDGKDLQYCRSVFGNLFVRATEKHMGNLRSYAYFNNFRGVTGTALKGKSECPVVITRTVGRVRRRYEFESVSEARAQLNVWLTQYPIEQFSMNYTRKNANGDFVLDKKISLTVRKPVNRNIGKTEWTRI